MTALSHPSKENRNQLPKYPLVWDSGEAKGGIEWNSVWPLPLSIHVLGSQFLQQLQVLQHL
jgi:hypothetical protein